MAKTFYTVDEAASKLGVSSDGVKGLVREGKLREFRDGGAVAYKVDDVNRLAGNGIKAAPPPPPPPKETAKGASSSGEIILEPAEDEPDLEPSGASDILTLGLAEPDDTAAGKKPRKEGSGGTSVPSAGINVFEDDELDEMVDPLAQTAVTDVGGLGLEGTGSGSGILELTRESDDTSLGSELLEEIYTDSDEGETAAADDTRAGLDEAAPADDAAPAPTGDEAFAMPAEAVERRPRADVVPSGEPTVDALSSGLLAGMVVAVLVLWVAGLGAAAMARGFAPSILRTLYSNLMIFAGAAFGVAIIASAVTYYLARRSK